MFASVLAPVAGRQWIPFAIGLAGWFLFYLFGLDQGHLLNVLQGSIAFDQNLIHEFVHDARHAAAMPCH